MSPRLRDWSDERGGRRRAGFARLATPVQLYGEGIRALARRELTTLQLRDKLIAAGGAAADVEQVLTRLVEEGALDDRRAARVYAQTAFRQRKRTRARIEEELEQIGIARDLAREVVEEVCGGEVERRRLEHAVIFGLRGTRRDHRDEYAIRLFGSLLRQGYAPQDVRLAFARAGVEVPTLDE